MASSAPTAAAAADLADGIGQFGLANLPKSSTLLAGLNEKPISAAPKLYLQAAAAEGLKPCLECLKLPLIEPKHTCGVKSDLVCV